MKRFLTVLLTTLALAGVLCAGASASTFDGAAAELASIGMLRGSATGGFQLDQAPTRAQAAIMLVRLFGAEDEAKAAYEAGDLTCPFTDVGETAAPYVAWLADKGLASGTSETTFGAANPCTAKAYTIFLLRALGYKDNEDFTTANAEDFAMGIGLLDTSMFTGTFLRDDLAALTYQALGTDMKGGETYLLKSLVDSGAIDAAAAKTTTDKIEAYRALQASSAAMGEGLDATVDAKMNMTVSIKGSSEGESVDMTETQAATVSGSIQAIVDKDIQMAMDLTVQIDEESQKMEMWLKDGVTYVRSGEEAYKTPVEGMEEIQALLEQTSGQSGASMLPFIASITTTTSNGDTVYTMTLNDAFGKMLNGIFQVALQGAPVEGADMGFKVTLDGTAIAYTVGQDGKLKNASIDMKFQADVKADAGTAGNMTIGIGADMDMDMAVKASGKDVKITFPDFSGFEEIIGGADGPTSIVGVTTVPTQAII